MKIKLGILNTKNQSPINGPIILMCSNFSLSKSNIGLVGLTKSVSVEMSKYKIRSNIINPGFTKTSFYKSFKKDKKALYKWTTMRTPMKRWGEPEEIANLVCFLLSNKSSYITGESINIDGGWTSS